MTQQRLIRLGLLALGAIAIAIPFFVNSMSFWILATRITYYLLLVLSWNLISGYAGIFSFGHVAFAAIGAYASGILTVDAHVPIALSILVGGIVAGVGGLLLGLLGQRISGPYLVVVSFAFLRVVQITIQAQSDITGGVSGMVVPPLVTGSKANQITFLIGVGLVIAYLIAQTFVLKSHWRHYLYALKDNEFAAVAMGGRPRLWKSVVFASSAAVAGIAGAFFGHSVGFITPDIGGLAPMAMVVVLGMLGGLGTTAGPVVATILVLYADSSLRATTGAFSTLIFGFVLLVVILAVPGGLSGVGNRLLAVLDRARKRDEVEKEKEEAWT